MKKEITAFCRQFLRFVVGSITSSYAGVDSWPGSRGRSVALSPLQSFDMPSPVSLSIRGLVPLSLLIRRVVYPRGRSIRTWRRVVVDLRHLGVPRWGGGSRSRGGASHVVSSLATPAFVSSHPGVVRVVLFARVWGIGLP